MANLPFPPMTSYTTVFCLTICLRLPNDGILVPSPGAGKAEACCLYYHVFSTRTTTVSPDATVIFLCDNDNMRLIIIVDI